MDNTHKWLWGTVVSVILVGVGWVTGSQYGDKKGYERAQADVKAVQDQAAQKAGADAAKAANPFQAVNPLQGVNANPFEKAKSILNPFK